MTPAPEVDDPIAREPPERGVTASANTRPGFWAPGRGDPQHVSGFQPCRNGCSATASSWSPGRVGAARAPCESSVPGRGPHPRGRASRDARPRKPGDHGEAAGGAPWLCCHVTMINDLVHGTRAYHQYFSERASSSIGGSARDTLHPEGKVPTTTMRETLCAEGQFDGSFA